jgi:hypothetical protein
VSISEKETSGVGTDLNSNPPITPSKGTKRTVQPPKSTDKKKTDKHVKRSNSLGTSESSNNSRRQPILQRIASAIKLKSPDSAVGSSIGQYDADIESMDRGRRESGGQNLQPVIEHHEDVEFEDEKVSPNQIKRSYSVRMKHKNALYDLPTKWSSAIELPCSY